MTKKRKDVEEQEKQLSLFDSEDEVDSKQFDDSIEDWLQNENFGFDSEPSDRTIELPRELLTLTLFHHSRQRKIRNLLNMRCLE